MLQRHVDVEDQGVGPFDPDPVAHVRWLPWLLGTLVLICVLLAAWVWFQILHV